MHTRRRAAQLQAKQLPTAQVKDEVYRQMFRLEESRPGADMGLALALLHGLHLTAVIELGSGRYRPFASR